ATGWFGPMDASSQCVRGSIRPSSAKCFSEGVFCRSRCGDWRSPAKGRTRIMAGHSMSVVVDDEKATERRAEVRGSIDVFSSAMLPVRALAGLPDTARSLVIDLREVSFVDSAGVSALVKLRREAHTRAVDVRARI